MIILLTGKPGIGKSTVIQRVVESRPDSYWVVTKSIPLPGGGRAGFEAHRYDGTQRIISHKTDLASDVIIGKNHVDLQAVEDMFGNVLEHVGDKGRLAVIDEIGPIQLLSSSFYGQLDATLDSGGPLLATIHYDDERLAKYRDDPNNLLIAVSEQNRDELPTVIDELLQRAAHFDALTPRGKRTYRHLLQSYLDDPAPIQLKKLIHNALEYASSDMVSPTSSEQWSVRGKHGSYHVRRTGGDGYSCTCDLYNGRNEYQGHAGECSHVQAVRIIVIGQSDQ